MTDKVSKNILIVCTGNSCRSAMAEGILKELLNDNEKVKVISAGTHTVDGFQASKYAVSVMKEVGIDISRHRTRKLTPDIIEEADVILTMTDYHREYVFRNAPDAQKARNKTYLLSHFDNDKSANPNVHDPIGEPISEYRVCRDRIIKLLENFKKIL